MIYKAVRSERTKDLVTRDQILTEELAKLKNESVTVKLADGGSKIVFSDSTEIEKSVSGAPSDPEIELMVQLLLRYGQEIPN